MGALEPLPLRYPATCIVCGANLAVQTRARWDKERREATCEPCLRASVLAKPAEVTIDRGLPGASARREGRRRQERREAQTIEAHPRLGKLILALSEEPQTIRSWKIGAIGEQELGNALEQLRLEGFGVLHDRRIPGTKANIDHIVVVPAGVFIVDAKRYAGRIERRDRGWLLDRDWRLYVNGKDKTKLAQGMARQMDAVQQALTPTPFAAVQVLPYLCFVDAAWPLLATSFEIGGTRIVAPRMLYKLMRSEGPLRSTDIAELERLLALALPAA